MSLLNAWITPSEAIVSVDTEAVGRDGSRKSISKLHCVSHLNAVLAIRGQNAFFANAVCLCLSRGFDSFDELLSEMPRLLEFANGITPAHMKNPAFPDTELIVAGWSDRESRMLARLYVQRGDAEFSERDTQGCIAPWDAATMSDIPTTPESIEQLARAQVDYMQTAGVGGGKLIVCRVTPDAVSMKQMAFETEAVCQR